MRKNNIIVQNWCCTCKRHGGRHLIIYSTVHLLYSFGLWPFSLFGAQWVMQREVRLISLLGRSIWLMLEHRNSCWLFLVSIKFIIYPQKIEEILGNVIPYCLIWCIRALGKLGFLEALSVVKLPFWIWNYCFSNSCLNGWWYQDYFHFQTY